VDLYARTIPPNTSPGGFYVRIVTASGHLLDEHPIGPDDAGPLGLRDADIFDRWLAEHPGDTAYVYIYDGDTGTCVKTVVGSTPPPADI
jgi:hypothetical protein